MPVMPRIEGKPKKIAYKILGVPQNIKNAKKDAEQKRIDRRLVFEETYRVR